MEEADPDCRDRPQWPRWTPIVEMDPHVRDRPRWTQGIPMAPRVEMDPNGQDRPQWFVFVVFRKQFF